MQFAAPRAGTLEPLVTDEHEFHRPANGQLASTVEIRIGPNAVAQAVLPRVLSALAARAYFSTDRISDVQLVADTLVANSPDSISGSHLGVEIDLAPRNLELRIGPLRAGSAKILIDAASDGLGDVIERLTDAQSVAASESTETLELRLVERQ
jgi:hypothetical protein